jgi:uncharacterized phage-associated protein
MVSAQHVARYIKDRQATPFGDLQLQKLLYYVQGWHLAWTGRPLFEEDFEAWKLGPVVPDVWRAGTFGWPIQDPGFTDDEQRSLDAVIGFYRYHSGAYLSDMSHDEAPWKEARAGLPVGAPSTRIIEKRALRRYFTGQATRDDVPHRPPAESQRADDDELEERTKAAIDRWRGALDLLAR